MWQDKTQVKKANIGEQIIIDYLQSIGCLVYRCINDKAHPVDFNVFKDGKLSFVEVKTKKRMKYYSATGFDTSKYITYLKLYNDYQLDVDIYFIDDHEEQKRIYHSKLSKLIESKEIDGIQYPNTSIAKGITLFSLQDMNHLRPLTDIELTLLQEHSS